MSINAQEPDLEIHWLDDKGIRIRRDDAGELWLVCNGEEMRIGRIVRLLPLSDPLHFISILDSDGNEVGIIRDVLSLEPQSRSILMDELERIYFMPKILRIHRITHDAATGNMVWEVNTDVGPRTLRIPSTDNIHKARYPRIFLIDEDGQRYEIPNCDMLDARSRRIVARYF